MGCNQNVITEKRKEIISLLSPIQAHIFYYLYENGFSTRDKLLAYLFKEGFFKTEGKDGDLKKMSNDYADRLMRSEIPLMVFKGVPVCTCNGDGYWIGRTTKEIDKAILDLRAKSSSLTVRADALEETKQKWIDPQITPAKISQTNWQRLHQLNLFDSDFH